MTKRPRLGLSVRLTMLLVVVAACGLGWVTNRARRQREAVEAIRKSGGWVHYDHEFVNGKLTAGREPPAPRWLRRIVGEEYFSKVTYVSLVYDDSTGTRYDNPNVSDSAVAHLDDLPGIKMLFLKETQATDGAMTHVGRLTDLEALLMWDARELTDVGVARLRGLKNLKKVHIGTSKMTDAGLGDLAGLPKLEEMALQGNHFTDRGLAHLARMAALRKLCVGFVGSGDPRAKGELTDAGMAHLEGLKSLELLDIQNSKVTDRGLDHLKGLPKLREIWKSGSRVTPEGIKGLQQAIPHPIVIE